MAKIDASSSGRKQEIQGHRAKGRQRYQGIPGVAHTLAISGQSFLLNANGSNFGSCFVILDPFEDREEHDKYDEEIAAKIRRPVHDEIEDAVVDVFRRRRFRVWATPAVSSCKPSSVASWICAELQRRRDELVARATKTADSSACSPSTGPRRRNSIVDIDRAKCETLQRGRQ